MTDRSITILCIGDPHFKEDNKRTTDELVAKTVALVKERQPDYVVIMGDTLHRFKTINQYASHDALRFFRELAPLSRLFVLIGNHDRPTPDDFLSDYHAFEALEGRDDMTIVNMPTSVYDETIGKHLLFVPFVPPQRFNDALAYFDSNDLNSAAMLFCHQEFVDSEYRSFTKSTHGDAWPSNPFPIVSGHIHKYQRLGVLPERDDQIARITYVGTPYQENFGEQDPKSVSLFTIRAEPLRYTEERIYLHCREKREVKIDAKRLNSFVHDDSIDWKIVLCGTPDELVVAQSSRAYADLQMKGVLFDRAVIDSDGDSQQTDQTTNDDETTSQTLLQTVQSLIKDKPALQKILREVLEQIDRST